LHKKLLNNYLAQKAGLIAGDLIEAMEDEVITPQHQIIPLRKLLRGAAGETIDLKVLRKGTAINANIILEELYPVDDKGCNLINN
jgi:S1-C subfamily serine protease